MTNRLPNAQFVAHPNGGIDSSTFQFRIPHFNTNIQTQCNRPSVLNEFEP